MLNYSTTDLDLFFSKAETKLTQLGEELYSGLKYGSVDESIVDKINLLSIIIDSILETQEQYEIDILVDFALDYYNLSPIPYSPFTASPNSIIKQVSGIGADGKSAYQLAVQQGYVGSLNQWLASLKGEDGIIGVDGNDGQSAYELWLEVGNSGTPEDFLDSLVGSNGTNGVGISSITLQSTVGLVKTYRITLTNSTTFDFTVTDGSQGIQGVAGTNGTNGSNGSNGTSSYTYVGYASDSSGTGFSLTPGSLSYIAVKVSNTPLTPVVGDFTGLWKKYVGLDAPVVQVTGTSTTDVMSQKAATDSFKPILAIQSLTDGATITWNMSGYEREAFVTLAGNRTLAITNPGRFGLIRVIQDGTGTRTLTLPSGSKVGLGGAGSVVLSSTAGASDILTFYYNGTNYFWNITRNYT